MKRSIDITWVRYKIGLFVLVALFLVALTIFMVGEEQNMFTPTVSLSILVNNAGGLKRGAPVWLSGVPIGSVKEIHFPEAARSDMVEVIINVNKKLKDRIGPNSLISIKTLGLLGDKYVDIEPGKGGRAGRLPKDARLEGLSENKMDVVLVKAIETIDQISILLEDIDRGTGTLGQLVKNPALYQDMEALANSFQKLAAFYGQGEGTLVKLLKDDQLYNRINKLVERMDGFALELQQKKGTLGVLIRDPKPLQNLIALMGVSTQTVKEFQSLLEALRSEKGMAGRLINDQKLSRKLDEVLDNVDRFVQNANVLVEDLKSNPKKYIHISLF